MNDAKSSNHLVRPITSKAEDAFDIKPRVVDKIIKIIETTGMGSFSIALAGELGIGKSSCLNLLLSELKSKQIITINFDPFALGKSEVSDIIELFYLKLYAELPSNKYNKIKEVLRKSIRSIAFLTRMKLSLGAGFDNLIGVNGHAKAEVNPGENLSDLLDLWEKESPEQINDQIESLAKVLKKSKKKIVILIDEVDRLPARQIINFLMFCRLLEKIDNLFSVVAVDYKQIIQKLTTEDGFQFLDYSQAQNYLDKFFQFKLQVHHNRYTILRYAINKIREFDHEELIIEVTEDGEYEEARELEKVVDYLGTPRKINKWLVSLRIHYPIIKYAGKWKREIIALLAGITVHPVFLDYLSLHALAF